jgi:hypothetical protein
MAYSRDRHLATLQAPDDKVNRVRGGESFGYEVGYARSVIPCKILHFFSISEEHIVFTINECISMPPFHGGNRGSNPLRDAKLTFSAAIDSN